MWDGEDLVGVYAEEDVARADTAVLQRDATRAGLGPGERGLPAAAGVHRAPAHPPLAAVDTAATGPIARTLPRLPGCCSWTSCRSSGSPT